MPTLRQQLNDLIDKLSPDMEKAFQAAINDIKSEIVLKEVIAYLERRDIEGAIAALHIDAAAFRPLYEQYRAAFSSGGALVIHNMPTLTDPQNARVVVRWDVSNQAAEANIRQMAGNMVTNVTSSTVEGIRSAIVSSYAAGKGPNSIALDLAGRKSAVTGKREGGVIGLTGPQSDLIERTRANLASGDPKLMRKYFDLKTRNKSLDKAVQRAIDAGKPLDAETLQKLLMRLRDANLRLRGETIARTETLTAVLNAKHEAYRQALAKANRDEGLVIRTWRSAGDNRVRHTHMALNAEEVTGMDMPFVSPSGAMLRYPGDSSLGAGAGEVINCRCDVDYRFNFIESYARSRGR